MRVEAIVICYYILTDCTSNKFCQNSTEAPGLNHSNLGNFCFLCVEIVLLVLPNKNDIFLLQNIFHRIALFLIMHISFVLQQLRPKFLLF